MENKKMILGISLDGVIRDMYSKFDDVYRKAFINNDSLIEADENFTYALPESVKDESEINKLEKLVNERINLPVNSDLQNHYQFDSLESFQNFFQEYAFEIFATAGTFPKTPDTLNRLQGFGKTNGIFDTVLLVKGTDKIVTSTYHFLAKIGCKINKIIFVENDIDKWDYCDVLIDDSPESFENKPDGKTSIKISHEYNAYSDSDYSFETLNAIYNELFILKIFRPDKYQEIMDAKKLKEKK
jgi:hypothetical protein